MKESLTTLWAQTFVDELIRQGLTDVVVSPGSRSTPLVAAFFERPEVRDWSVVDERTAAFFALGIAQREAQPVALVCTSGTAAAHYFPAICEAGRRGVPLLVFTADRPASLQDCGASQAMDQVKLFGDHIRYFHHVAEPAPRQDQFRYLRKLASRAWARSMSWEPGPVHLNFPFRKPLDPLPVEENHVDGLSVAEKRTLLGDQRPDGQPYTAHFMAEKKGSSKAIRAVVEMLRKAERPFIYHGAFRGIMTEARCYERELAVFMERTSIPLLAEATSRARQIAGALSQVDGILESSLLETQKPDLVLHLGMSPLGWAAQRRFRSWIDVPVIQISPFLEESDPEGLSAMMIQSEEGLFFEDLLTALEAENLLQKKWSDFGELLRKAEERAHAVSRDKSGLGTFWPALFELTANQGGAAVLSAGMVLRDADSFGGHEAGKVALFCNRGLNGIDGVMATGVGVATRQPVLILIGDVAFRHDVGSLFLAKELNLNATILIIDNGGGSIFDYLPIAALSSLHARHFRTEARLNPEEMITAGIEIATNFEDVLLKVEAAMENKGGVVLFRISSEEEREEREGLRSRIAAAVEKGIQTGGAP